MRDQSTVLTAINSETCQTQCPHRQLFLRRVAPVAQLCGRDPGLSVTVEHPGGSSWTTRGRAGLTQCAVLGDDPFRLLCGLALSGSQGARCRLGCLAPVNLCLLRAHSRQICFVLAVDSCLSCS